MRALALTAGLTFLADQALKWYVVVALDLANRLFVEVWPGLVQLTLALAICGWVVLWSRSEAGNTPFQIGAGLLVGGALGNVIDRVRWGAVADFLNVTCCGWVNPWAFNIADAAIFLGAVALILTAGAKKRA